MEGSIDLTSDGGVIKTILTAGKSDVQPTRGQKVFVNYIGKLENGKEFDRSEEPFVFKVGVGEVIKGWDIGVASMKVGEKCELAILSDYAYGDSGIEGVIPEKATLIFQVELLQVVNK
jgi:FKBP-type peptidyl-prolyl cis-trans isomerase